MLSQTALSHSDALNLVSTAKEELEKRGQGAAVAVVDAHGELMAFVRTDGCRLSCINVAINKAYTAAREQGESKALGEASRREGFALTNFGELRYVSWGGGLPLRVKGEVVGAVGVSGLPEQEDIAVAQLAVRSFESNLG